MEPAKDRCEMDASQSLNVLIVYESLAAGQRAMGLCRDLASQQAGKLSLQPRLWRLDVVADPVCGGLAIADAVEADLFVVSTSSQTELSKPAQYWLKLCLGVARTHGTCAAIVALLGLDDQVNDGYSLNLQFLRSLAQEAAFEFFAPFADRNEALEGSRAKVKAAEAPGHLDEAGAAVARQIAHAYQPAMLRAHRRDLRHNDAGSARSVH